MNKECPICKNNFISKREQITCSKNCASQWRSLTMKGLKHKPFHKKEINCPVCNTLFFPKRREIKTCSVECGHKLQGHQVSGTSNYNYNVSIPTHTCLQCGVLFRLYSLTTPARKGRGQFCSKACHNKSMLKDRVVFTCKGCATVFTRVPSRAVNDPNYYCSKRCYLKYGVRGSYKIKDMVLWLEELDVVLEREKTFDWLRNPKTNRNLFLDLFLPDHSIAIEYDGMQHFRPCLGYDTEKDVEYRQLLDNVKNSLCAKNGVTMIRFRYDENLSQEYFLDKLKLMV